MAAVFPSAALGATASIWTHGSTSSAATARRARAARAVWHSAGRRRWRRAKMRTRRLLLPPPFRGRVGGGGQGGGFNNGGFSWSYPHPRPLRAGVFTRLDPARRRGEERPPAK